MPGKHRAAVRSPRRWLITAMVVGLVAALVGPVGADSHGGTGYATTAAEYTLYADQDIDVGKVYVWDYDGDVFVQYVMGHEWCLLETHVEVTQSTGDIPQAKNGNPIPGQFSEGESFSGCETLAGHYVFEGVADADIVVAAHAEVRTAEARKVTFSTADIDDMTGFGRFSNPGGYATALTSETPATDGIRTLLESEENGAWNDSIGSPWVTIDDNANPDVDQWFRIDHSITVPGMPTGDGYVMVNSDNADEVIDHTSVTGKPGAITGEPIRPAHDQISEYTFPVAEGDNTVQFVVRNYFPTTTGSPNPMALTYSGYVDYHVYESAWAGEDDFESPKWAYYASYSAGDGTITDGSGRELTFLVFDLGASSTDLGGMAWVDGLQDYAAHTVCTEVSGSTAWFTYQIPADAAFAASSWVTFRVTEGGVVGYDVGSEAAMVELCESQDASVTGGWTGPTSGDITVHP